MTELQKRQYEKKKYGPFPQWTALHLVASKPAFSFDNAKVLHNEVLRLLLNKKPQLDKVNLDDETPLHLSVNAKNIDVAKSLIGAGADVNRVSVKWSFYPLLTTLFLALIARRFRFDYCYQARQHSSRRGPDQSQGQGRHC